MLLGSVLSLAFRRDGFRQGRGLLLLLLINRFLGLVRGVGMRRVAFQILEELLGRRVGEWLPKCRAEDAEAEAGIQPHRWRAWSSEGCDVQAPLEDVKVGDDVRDQHRQSRLGRSGVQGLVIDHPIINGRGCLFAGCGKDLHDDHGAADRRDGVRGMDLDGFAGFHARTGHVQGDLTAGQVHDGRLLWLLGNDEI